MKSYAENYFDVLSLPGAERNSNTNPTSSADLQEYNSCRLQAVIHSVTDGTHTPVAYESENGTTWTAVAAADLDGAFEDATAAGVQSVGYLGGKRYVGVGVDASGTTGAIVSGVAIRAHKKRQ